MHFRTPISKKIDAAKGGATGWTGVEVSTPLSYGRYSFLSSNYIEIIRYTFWSSMLSLFHPTFSGLAAPGCGRILAPTIDTPIYRVSQKSTHAKKISRNKSTSQISMTQISMKDRSIFVIFLAVLPALLEVSVKFT